MHLKGIGAAAIGILLAACWVKPVTREDRAAVSNALANRDAGAIISDRELAQADQDETVVCEDVRATGSHIVTRKCRTMRRVDEEKKQTDRNMEGPRICTMGDCQTR